jgi:hypothetical protein
MSATKCQLFAMKDAGISISCVHIDKKYVIFDNGVKLKIRLFDEYDDEVDDPEDAVYYEFGDEEFGFGSAFFHLEEFQEWNQ